ncbi:MAG: S9 family peptidase [Bacteroidales bacterium]|nr:S9 family peptidase [Bacteroidales bacterium]
MKKTTTVLIATLMMTIVALQTQAQNDHKEITLSDVFRSGKFYPRGVSGMNSMNDGKHYTVLEKDSLVEYSYKTGDKTRVIVGGDQLIPEGEEEAIRISSYKFSDDESKLLLATQRESIYRRSSKSHFYIYDLENNSLQPLTDMEKGKVNLAAFSPDASKIAFVRDNNLFLKNLETGSEKPITSDGLDRHIINGTTDWVYEEEFSIVKGFYWSPDGENIAYMRFDESDVKEYWLTKYGDLYPDEHKYKYPKAGEENSVVDVYIYHVSSGEKVQVDMGDKKYEYVPRIRWTQNPEELAVYLMNRHQNKLFILGADASTGKSRKIYSEKNKYYLEIEDYDNMKFLEDGEHFILKSVQDGYHHIYMYDLQGNQVSQITDGEWEVTSIEGIDEDREEIYFMSTENSPLQRQLYKIKFNGRRKKQLTEREGINSISFSYTYDYYVNNWSDANTPSYISVHKSNGKELRTLQKNEKVQQTIKEYGFSPIEFFSFNHDSVGGDVYPYEGKVTLNGYMIKPPDFDPAKEYPVFMYVYGGPGSQLVMDRWNYRSAWFQMLAQKGYIVACVDNRGTGGRGQEFQKMTYLELGKYETIDQIEAAKYLAGLDYVDEERIGMFGWSYGGFMTSLCMTKGAEHFKTGIAVALVSNWRYYDNIYTERFMRTPQENPDGYDQNSPINHAEKLDANFLIVHGTADDNVHPQNSWDFIKALVAANKQFDMQMYVNSNHGIYTGKNTTYHLYDRMTRFILENL